MSADSTPRQAIILGLFIAIATSILIGGLFALGTLRERFTSRIEVSASFERVDGLKKGDAVWYSGVPVGRVARVRLADGGTVAVDLAVDRAQSERIPGDVVARISSDGLIGNAIVVFDQGTPGGAPLQEGAALSSIGTVTMEQLMGEIQKSNENLLAITGSVRVVTDKIAGGEGTLGKLVHDDALYVDLRAAMVDIRSAADKAADMTEQGSQLARAMNRPGHLPYDLAHNKSLVPSLVASAESVQQTTTDAQRFVASVDEALQRADTPVGVLLRDQQSGANLEQTFENLAASSSTLSGNLEAMQENWLLGGLFTTKEDRKERRTERRAERRGETDVEADGSSE
jgi:phospholipid/cholesterol/gamma-HCH transport system substrate-binding protein